MARDIICAIIKAWIIAFRIACLHYAMKALKECTTFRTTVFLSTKFDLEIKFWTLTCLKFLKQ